MKANTYTIPFHPNNHEMSTEISDNFILKEMRDEANANTPSFLPKIGSFKKKITKNRSSGLQARLPHVDRRSQDSSIVDLKLDATLDTHNSKLGYTYITLPSEDDRQKSIFDSSNISKKQEIVGPSKNTCPDYVQKLAKRTIAQRRFNVLKNKKTADTDSDDSDQDYIETTPGPGAYTLPQSFIKKTFRSQKPYIRDIFLTKQAKNGQKKQNDEQHVPPIVQANTPPKKQTKQISFLSQSVRFKQKKNDHSAQIGSYKPRNSIQNDLINRLVRGLKGRFGSNVQRFVKFKEDDLGPGYYENTPSQNIYKFKPQSTYNSKVERVIFQDKSNIPGPGDYDIVKEDNQRDEFLDKIKVKKAPFNSTEERSLFGRQRKAKKDAANSISVKSIEQKLLAEKVMRA